MIINVVLTLYLLAEHVNNAQVLETCTVFEYYCIVIMTLRQRYKSLNNPSSVKKMVVTSVYHTMQMEGQPVSKERIESLYNQVKIERQEQKERSLQKS